MATAVNGKGSFAEVFDSWSEKGLKIVAPDKLSKEIGLEALNRYKRGETLEGFTHAQTRYAAPTYRIMSGGGRSEANMKELREASQELREEMRRVTFGKPLEKMMEGEIMVLLF